MVNCRRVYFVKSVRNIYIYIYKCYTLSKKKNFYPASSKENLGVNGWTGAFP